MIAPAPLPAPLRIPCGQRHDRVACASLARRFARAAGLGSREASHVAICVAELVGNAAKHAGGGALSLRIVLAPRRAVEVVVEDLGPGLLDASRAVEDGWSRGRRLAPDDQRRDGLGAGLGAVQRLMSGARVDSVPGRGTTVTAWKYF